MNVFIFRRVLGALLLMGAISATSVASAQSYWNQGFGPRDYMYSGNSLSYSGAYLASPYATNYYPSSGYYSGYNTGYGASYPSYGYSGAYNYYPSGAYGYRSYNARSYYAPSYYRRGAMIGRRW